MLCCGGRKRHYQHCHNWRPRVDRRVVCAACADNAHRRCPGKRRAGRGKRGQAMGPLRPCECWCAWPVWCLREVMEGVNFETQDLVLAYAKRGRKRRARRR